MDHAILQKQSAESIKFLLKKNGDFSILQQIILNLYGHKDPE